MLYELAVLWDPSKIPSRIDVSEATFLVLQPNDRVLADKTMRQEWTIGARGYLEQSGRNGSA